MQPSQHYQDLNQLLQQKKDKLAQYNNKTYANTAPQGFQDEYIEQDDEGLYSNDEGELDQSFDDSDIQNKDPGKINKTIIPIEDIQNQLKELNDAAVLSLKDEDVESANDKLKRCEQILENLTSEGRDVDRNQIIIVLHNLA
jgi:predicted translin family RNA/ssDNA-binding protein